MHDRNTPIDTTSRTHLAIHGGPPALANEVPSWPPADDDVRQAIERAWGDGSWGRYHGPHVQRLEAELAAMHGLEFVTSCCSGTFAVELALRSVGIGPGDEVILAGYDFPGNFRAVEATGARPVLVDVEPSGWSLDPSELPRALSGRTRAILASHLHASLVDMPRVVEFARAHRLAVIEDACQAPAARVAGRIAGTWGDVSTLSFGGSKLLTAGRGGAMLTASAEIHQRAKVFCQRGNHAFPLSELQAAVLLPQLAKLDARNDRRRANAARLVEQTAELTWLAPLGNPLADSAASFYKLSWLYSEQAAPGCPIDTLVAALQAEGIPCDRGFRGFVDRSDRRCRKVGSLAHSRRAAAATVLLHHPILLAAPENTDAVARAMAKVAQGLSGLAPGQPTT